MSASAVVTVASADNVLVVPIEAIQTDADGNKYVVVLGSDGNTSNVTVTTGLSSSSYVEVQSGLTEGQTVQYTVTTTNSSSRGTNGTRSMFQLPSGRSPNFQDDEWRLAHINFERMFGGYRQEATEVRRVNKEIIMKDIIKMTNVTKIYKMGDDIIRAIDSINFNVKAGEFISIVGPSGSREININEYYRPFGFS